MMSAMLPRRPASTPARASPTTTALAGATPQPSRRLEVHRGVGLSGQAQVLAGHAVDQVADAVVPRLAVDVQAVVGLVVEGPELLALVRGAGPEARV